MKKTLMLAMLLVAGVAEAGGRHKEINCFETADGGRYNCNNSGGDGGGGGGGGGWTTTTTSSSTTTTTVDNTGGINLSIAVNGGPVGINASIGSPNQTSTTTTTNSTTTVTSTGSDAGT